MARRTSPWCALRPALLAGAAAAMWLALSSTAASADAGPGTPPLLGNVTGSVSTMTQDLASAASPVASPDGPAAAPGLVQTVAVPVSEAGDTIISTVPVVDKLVPTGSVSAVSAPVGRMADQIAAGVTEVVAAPAAEAVPALQPVADLLTDAAATPLPLPAPTVDAVLEDLPSVVAPVPAAGPEALESLPDVPGMLPEADQRAEALPTAPAGRSSAGFATVSNAALANASGPQAGMSVPAGAASEQPIPVDPAPLPAQVPAAPASGTGSDASSGGPAGAAAWLSPAYFGFERPGAVPAGATFEHAPAPVSFDPGSSPD